MNNIENNFVVEIKRALKKRLRRELLNEEIEAFSCPRSYVAYEMILDYLNDDSKSQKELMDYIKSVIKEYKTTANHGYKA